MKNILMLCTASMLMITGCTTTITPKPVTDNTASFDGNTQNSGFIGFDSAGAGILTPGGRDRYNELIEKYGVKFMPELNKDAGITESGSVYLIDAEHLVYFMTMNAWRKEGK